MASNKNTKEFKEELARQAAEKKSMEVAMKMQQEEMMN